MEKKICIITGANAGIGRQAAAQLAQEECHVILACRNKERGETALNSIRAMNSSFSAELKIVDMGQLSSVTQFAEEIKKEFKKVDILIHNAAVFNITQKDRIETKEGIETVWATNHIGPVLLTELLLNHLKKSENGRVITIASKGLIAKPFLKVNLKDPEFKLKKFSIVDAYYQSKLAQIMYTYWLADKLKGTMVTANCIRVTAVKIDINRHPELSNFMKWVYKQKAKQSISTEKMAETYTWLALDPELDHITGKYFDEKNLEVESKAYTRSKENIEAVMKLTMNYIPEQK